MLRGVLLLGMVFIFIAGLSLPRAFGDRATLSACSYAGVRLLHLGPLRPCVATWQRLVGGDLWIRHDVVIGMALLIIAGSFLAKGAGDRRLPAGG